MADNSLRYRTNPVLPRSHPSSDDDAFDSGQEPGNDLINAGSDDPLAELARLVGQVDPFDDRRPPARPSRDPWEADDRSDPEYAARHLQAPPLADYRYGDPEEGDAQQGYAEGQSANWHTREHATYDEPAQAGGAYYSDGDQAAGHAQHADDQYADDEYGEEQYADEQYAEEQYAEDGYAPYEAQENAAPPARRGKLVTVGLVLGLAVVGTAGAYAFRTVFSGGVAGTPAVIKADTSPTKIAAAPSDGTGSKQIIDRIGDRGQNERMVPREEQPLDIKSPAPQGQAATGG